MTKQLLSEVMASGISIDSPAAATYCIDESGSIAVNGTCGVDTTCLWFKFLDAGQDCGTFTENPIQCGASQIFPDSSGNWSAGSVSPGSSAGYGSRCLIIWFLNNDSTSITAVVRNFTFLPMDDPACEGSGSGSGGGSAAGGGSVGGWTAEEVMPWEHSGKRRGKRRGEKSGARQPYIVGSRPGGRQQAVIRDKAPRAYQVTAPEGTRWSGVALDFDAARSSQRRAHWRNTGKSGSWALDVRRSREGKLEATLTYFRFGKRSVRGPFVWTGNWCFRKKSVTLCGAGLPDLVIEAA